MYRTRSFALALDRPLSTAAGEIDRRQGFLIGVEGSPTDVGTDSDGAIRGVGEATPLPDWTESAEDCRGTLASLPDDVAAGYPTNSVPPALTGTPAAAHGVQTAVLDRAARRAGAPLSTLLADEWFPDHDPPATVPANATVGDGDVSETVAAAERAVEAGFGCLKLKVGARPLADDLDRVRAVTDAVDADVRLDANAAWDRETAGRAIDELAAAAVAYVEQPLPPDDLDGLAALRGRGVDVAVDESLVAAGVDAVLAAEAADVAICKPMALGGPGTAARVAATLREAGVEPVVTTTVDGAVARAAATHVAAAVPDVAPCGLATADLLAEDLLPDPAPIEDGRVRVPAGPGICGDAADDLLW